MPHLNRKLLLFAVALSACVLSVAVAAAGLSTSPEQSVDPGLGADPTNTSVFHPDQLKLPQSVHNDVETGTLEVVSRTDAYTLLVGNGARPELDCVVLSDPEGATVGCHEMEDLPPQGGIALRAYRPDGSSAIVLHLPQNRAVASIEFGGELIPAPLGKLALVIAEPDDRVIVVNSAEGRVVHHFGAGSEAFDIGIE